MDADTDVGGLVVVRRDDCAGVAQHGLRKQMGKGRWVVRREVAGWHPIVQSSLKVTPSLPAVIPPSNTHIHQITQPGSPPKPQTALPSGEICIQKTHPYRKTTPHLSKAENVLCALGRITFCIQCHEALVIELHQSARDDVAVTGSLHLRGRAGEGG